MIEVKQRDDQMVYWSPERSVWLSRSSGETSTFSPDGKEFILHAGNDYFTTQLGEDIHAFDRWPLVIWSARGDLWEFKWHTNTVHSWGESQETLSVPRPSWAQYGKLQEVSSGKRLQMLVFYRVGRDPKREVVLFDRSGVRHRWEFDRRVHQGDAKTDRWHELFLADEWLVCNLSTNGPGSEFGLRDYPHFRLRPDGTGWEPIRFSTLQNYHRSHVTLDKDYLAAGYWDGPVPKIEVSDIATGNLISGRILPSYFSYGHGCLRDPWLIYSLYDLRLESDVQVRVWNVATSSDELVAGLTPTDDRDFYSRARPMINRQGTLAAWHEVEDDRTVVVVKRLQGEPPEENKALEKARELQKNAGELVELLEGAA